MNNITTSIFDLFKIGPGPSSSHTIGPMKAAQDFLESAQKLSIDQVKGVDRIEARLYGSLSATGKGHGTDRAILGGLLGWRPETCDSEEFVNLFDNPERRYEIKIKDQTVAFRQSDIYYDAVQHSFPFQNTMILRLFAGDKPRLEKEYYSIGGGFVKIKGEDDPVRGSPRYGYANMEDLKKIIAEQRISLSEIVLANEETITGSRRGEIIRGVQAIIAAMMESVERGLRSEGVLPGSIGLERKAAALYQKRDLPEHLYGRYTLLVSAYAIAAAEENAAHHKVVTAPTLGSAGVVPGIIYGLKEHFRISNAVLVEGMLAASAVGFIVKHNASISGAEVGCQGEIGVASSMAAALLAYIYTRDIMRVTYAATIALEHSLGWTCDPVGGYVQIPCIDRNAIGASHAVSAFVLAKVGDPTKEKATFDEVVQAMLETGRDMSTKYKETSEGGLAKCLALC